MAYYVLLHAGITPSYYRFHVALSITQRRESQGIGRKIPHIQPDLFLRSIFYLFMCPRSTTSPERSPNVLTTDLANDIIMLIYCYTRRRKKQKISRTSSSRHDATILGIFWLMRLHARSHRQTTNFIKRFSVYDNGAAAAGVAYKHTSLSVCDGQVRNDLQTTKHETDGCRNWKWQAGDIARHHRHVIWQQTAQLSLESLPLHEAARNSKIY